MLKRLIVLRDEKASLTVFSVPDSSNLPVKIASYCFEALKQNYEGEVLTLIVAGLYHLLFCTEDAKVEVHPVNELSYLAAIHMYQDIYNSYSCFAVSSHSILV